MKQFLLFCISGILGFQFVLGQQGATIKGKVLDADGAQVSFASVMLFQGDDSSLVKTGYSNDKGAYFLTPLSAGAYFLSIEFAGLSTFRSDLISVGEGETVEMPDVVMRVPEADMDEVNIVARKPLVEVKPDMTVFNVAGNTNAIGENGFDLLRKAPGVIIDNNDNILLMGKSGVRIYIDGKPSPLSVQDLANMLKGMQSDQIEAIEIITNPSAKYDAEGNAGIINIRLKKDKSLGTNGTLTLGFGHGVTPRFNFPKYNGGLNLNYRNKKVNIFGNYSGGVGQGYSFTDFYRVQSGLVFDQTTDRFNEYQNNNFKAGIDIFLNKKHTIGILYNGMLNYDSTENISLTPISIESSNELLQTLEALSLGEGQRSNSNINLNYRYDNKKGVTLNVDADYGTFRLRQDLFQPNTYLNTGDEVDSVITFSSIAPTDIDIATFKTDYERPLMKGKFGAGFKLALVETDNDFQFFNVIQGQNVADTNRTNRFIYSENVNAGYVNYQRQVKKWNFSVGLRAEYTGFNWTLTSLGDQASENDTAYFNLFPSGGITFTPNRANSIRLNYSRRIDRPRYQDLNPFIYQLDKLTFQQGNPTLLPQFTHNLQATYTYKYRYNATLGYSRTSGFFTRLTDTLGQNASFITFVNLGSRDVISLNLGAPVSLAKWWNTYTNLTVSNTRNRGDFNNPGETGKEIDIARTTFNIFQQHTFTLPKGFSVELSGFYNSPSIWGANYLTQRFWMVNGGVQKRMLDNKVTAKLSISDIFYSGQWRGTQEFGGLFFDAQGGWESRRVNINISYNFGNQQVKTSRRRKTGLETESNRINGTGSGPGN